MAKQKITFAKQQTEAKKRRKAEDKRNRRQARKDDNQPDDASKYLDQDETIDRPDSDDPEAVR